MIVNDLIVDIFNCLLIADENKNLFERLKLKVNFVHVTDHCSSDASALCSTDSKHDMMCSGSRTSYSN